MILRSEGFVNKFFTPTLLPSPYGRGVGGEGTPLSLNTSPYACNA
jgi:hypothetical protein